MLPQTFAGRGGLLLSRCAIGGVRQNLDSVIRSPSKQCWSAADASSAFKQASDRGDAAWAQSIPHGIESISQSSPCAVDT